MPTERLYNNLVDQCDLYKEAMKYYANILTPFSAILRKKLDEIIAFPNLESLISLSWRTGTTTDADSREICAQWAGDYQENQITIIYDTMWNGTKPWLKK